MKGRASLGAVAQQLHGWRTILRTARVKGKFIALASWIAFLVSAVSEFVVDIDFPLMPPVWLAIGICLLFTSAAHAQFTANFQTITISGVTSNWAGNYVVGDTNFLDTLVLQSGGVLSNNQGLIGNSISASNNTAIVTGSGSIWSNQMGVAVGVSGAGNSLIISNGGVVHTLLADNAIGFNISSSNDTATITGTGSAWRTGHDLYVGYLGKNSHMTISGGGVALNVVGLLGNIGVSTSNSVTVSGTSSIWSNTSNLVLGNVSVGNRVTVTNGGAVINIQTLMGNSSTSLSNAAIVAGTGSLWRVTDFFVGWGAAGNQLTITGGGVVQDHSAMVGRAGKNCLATVLDAGSVWSNSLELFVGYQSATNTLNIDNSGSVVTSNLYVSSTFSGIVGNRVNINGGTLLVSSNAFVGTVDCTATGEITLNTGNLFVTNNAGNATLAILSGTLTQNGGVMQVDKLILTNACAHFVHTGGTLTVGSAVLATNFDADGDGISNGYEQSHGLDPLNAADANVDSDGDGLSNLQEFLAGTDATNSASAFRVLSVAVEGNDIRVTWMMGSGKTNALQFASGPSFTTNFANLFIVTNTVGSVTNYLDAGAFTNLFPRYYRVRLVP